MNRWYIALILAPLAIAAAGCNTMAGTPEFQQAAIAPPQLTPGDTAVITLEVKDRHRVIERIEGVVKEDPRITFRMRDDGVAPDEKAGDNIWSLQVDVPFQAPPGEFVLEFTAYTADGVPVPVRDTQGEVVPLTQELPVVIRYEQQQQ